MKIIHKILITFLIEVFIFPLWNSLYATEGENVFQEPWAVEDFWEQPQGEEIAIEETTFSQETLPEENHITETSISEESITTLPEDTISSTPLEENFITW